MNNELASINEVIGFLNLVDPKRLNDLREKHLLAHPVKKLHPNAICSRPNLSSHQGRIRVNHFCIKVVTLHVE